MTAKKPRQHASTWLTRNVLVLSVVSFLQDIASELVYPFIPVYLTVVLGAPPSVVGAVEGAAEAAASLGMITSGALGDRFSRRPLIAGGYGMAALGKLVVAIATTWPGVLAGRVVDRLGKGVRDTPRDALLVEGIDSSQRGRLFGFHRTMDTAGAVLGPLLGLGAYELLDHRIKPVLLLAVIPAALSVLLVFWIHERPRARTGGRSIFAGARRLSSRYWRVVAFIVGFCLVNLPPAQLLLRLHDIGFSMSQVLLAYVCYNAVYALSSFPAGLLADRISAPVVFGVGLVCFAVSVAGLAFTTEIVVAWLLLAVYGIFTACYDGVGKTWVSTVIGADLQSSAQGVFQGASGFAILFAGLWTGLLWGTNGHLPLLISGAVGALCAIGLFVAAAVRHH